MAPLIKQTSPYLTRSLIAKAVTVEGLPHFKSLIRTKRPSRGGALARRRNRALGAVKATARYRQPPHRRELRPLGWPTPEPLSAFRLSAAGNPELAARYLGDAGSAVYLMRPDQHVAARWDSYDAAEVRRAVNIATARDDRGRSA